MQTKKLTLDPRHAAFSIILLVGPLLINTWTSTAAAQSASALVADSAYTASSERLELRKLDLEKQKLEEQRKATWLTLATVTVSALVGFGTVVYNIRNANRQNRLQAKLKAIEVVVSANGPNTAKERLQVVSHLLGGDLIDPQIAESFIARGVGAGHDQNRKELIAMMMSYPDRRLEVLRFWEIAFGRSKLNDDIQKLKGEISNGAS